eukprot:CAMPEP_0117424698 /NCGR_PEP_ID=MMETSP0758-20121206/5075_1 /TAXON_ID=63605 /ORGANISM="Percolomonas cosmopolitus, Strain AE-1 (ATCC 50343)" /LENGTH=1147 /DNA_ID=CAMNT_0005208653 /DNA_START=283 /DNA_END=3722 /DNA_ORIENTATION=+
MMFDITPLTALRLFEHIPDVDVELFDMDPLITRPEQLIMTRILVPPNCIRPTVPSDRGFTEDDLTSTLASILISNKRIEEAMKRGRDISNLYLNWNELQQHCAKYIDSDMSGFSAKAKPKKPTRSLCQRLKGKQGRFRGNLSGKRVDFSGRTVISPDPNLLLHEVAVPVFMAKKLSYPERVNRFNIKKLRTYVRNGPDVHPGAHYIKYGKRKLTKNLKICDRKLVAKQLQIGDIVERHLMDGDIVLFNRQPSLHRMSILCHRVRVLPYKTLRFNVCVCNPYNADFDGDEMNLHVPQTEEARAEAWELMRVTRNMITPKNGEPLISVIQDFITMSYIITSKDQYFDRAEIMALCFHADIPVKELPMPAIIKPIELWTGKQFFSLMMRVFKNEEVNVNLIKQTKNYDKKKNLKEMCPNDGWIHILNSELISGRVDKKILGSGSKDSIAFMLMKRYGNEYSSMFMSRIARITSHWLLNRGFSIGLSDVTPSSTMTLEKKKILKKGYFKVKNEIAQWRLGKLEADPGCTVEETLESKLNSALSDLRNICGTMCEDKLHHLNAPLVMAKSGAKGSTINISQMIACVGQQTVSGSRIAYGFVNRTLPHFSLSSKDPVSRGFVSNSFFTGLTPTEFFFHTMGGREGLVDTAVKTAETGYMQRRLVKALEDLHVTYDGTVRNSEGSIIQLKFGDDGLDPVRMEGDDGRPIAFANSLRHVQNVIPDKSGVNLLPDEVLQLTEQFCDELLTVASGQFIKEFKEFFLEHIEFMRQHYDNIPSDIDSLKFKLYSITQRQLEHFFSLVKNLYARVEIEPGEAVGAVAAQSIGEPATQMTLKTFHFAGVASMNITLGVPRIVELINASKDIKTPIITSQLENPSSQTAALITRGRIEKMTLGEVASIYEIYDDTICYFKIVLSTTLISNLSLDLDSNRVAKALLSNKLLDLKKPNLVKIENDHELFVYPPAHLDSDMYFSMQSLKRELPHTIVLGIPSISRAIFTPKQDNKNEYQLIAEGVGLADVMNIAGVDGCKTRTNSTIETKNVLGIEAARNTIISEISKTLDAYGMSVDSRHMMLLGDLMTCKGEVLGVTRHGIQKMRDSVMMLASFERTNDHLFNAAVHSRCDQVIGVSECIIMGVQIGLGTGHFKLLQDVKYAP